jgi:outer membrane lipoprotein-sorting protein
VELVLRALQQKAEDLTSFQTRIDYVVKQPLLESQLRRTGDLNYLKIDGKSNLRINFGTLQQDDEPEQKYGEQFLFDGVWLVHVDYQTERVERRQLTEPNRPLDAFALASKHVPVVGFAKVEDLHEQFTVELVPPGDTEASPFHHLHLKVKVDSIYKDDYVTIDFWIDKKVGLPTKVMAVTTEEDVHEILFVAPKVNVDIDRKTFLIDAPSGFSREVIPLASAAPER